MDTELLIAHVQMLQGVSENAARAHARATEGLAFAKSQEELTKGFTNGEYWHGKVDAYTAILELLDAA